MNLCLETLEYQKLKVNNLRKNYLELINYEISYKHYVIFLFCISFLWKSNLKDIRRWYSIIRNCIDGVMVTMLTTSVVDHGFKAWSSQTKQYEVGICCFSAKQAALKMLKRDVSY